MIFFFEQVILKWCDYGQVLKFGGKVSKINAAYSCSLTFTLLFIYSFLILSQQMRVFSLQRIANSNDGLVGPSVNHLQRRREGESDWTVAWARDNFGINACELNVYAHRIRIPCIYKVHYNTALKSSSMF